MEPNLSYDYEIDELNHIKSDLYEIHKRFIDIFGALLGIIMLLPLFIIVAIAIKHDSKGPVIFAQKRCSKNGRIFKMYKFRSMELDAEDKQKDLVRNNEMTGPVFKIKNDPRITKVGKFLRRTSIDELPQLINVLKGDMSIVGPRPPIHSEVEKYNSYQRQRLLIKSGLTCYWQTMGRNNIGFDKWVDLDIQYIQERSTWIDIKLIFKTFFVIFIDLDGY